MENQIAIFALTRAGSHKAVLLHSQIGGDLYLPEKFREDCASSGAVFFDGPASGLMARLFPMHKKIIGFCALGAMVRLIAPHLRDKTLDPAVVALDEGGKYAISVVSGHLGGANALARDVARAMGAEPVITTATDAAGILAPDLLGRELGWTVEKRENLVRAAASLVNGEKVAMVQTRGEDVREMEFLFPDNLLFFPSLEAALKSDPDALLLVTDQIVDGQALGALADRTVVYRPKTLAAGVGCNAGTAPEELEAAILEVLKQEGLSTACLKILATIDQKREEPAIRAFSEKHGVPLVFFSASELNQVKNVPNPSAMARKHVGAQGVAEPAALLAAGAETLLREKTVRGNVTVALTHSPPRRSTPASRCATES